MHVDGFRFDLASLFTRNSDGSINLDDPPIIFEISADPDFADIRLIAEVWDVELSAGQKLPGNDLVPVEWKIPGRPARISSGRCREDE